MELFLSALFLLSTVRANSEDLIIFDNFDYGSFFVSPEPKVVDYAVLALDRKMDLPTSFTICSSVHMNFVIAPIVFYQLYQDDGKPWFNFFIRDHRDLNGFQEKMRLRYYQSILSDMNTVPIMPNSWYHGCTALDTVIGHMLIMVNGKMILDQVIEEFVDSANEKPKFNYVKTH